MKTYDIVISDAALALLDAHMVFLAKVNGNAARHTMTDILNSIESLGKNPNRYPVYESPFISHNRYRKMLCAKRYLIIYEVLDDTVFVDYVLDCRQDYEWMLV